MSSNCHVARDIFCKKIYCNCIKPQSRDVNETLRSETETRPRRLASSSRRDRDRDLPTFHEIETETLIGRDRDIFRDLDMLSFIFEVFLPCMSFSSKLNKFKNSEVCRAMSLCRPM